MESGLRGWQLRLCCRRHCIIWLGATGILFALLFSHGVVCSAATSILDEYPCKTGPFRKEFRLEQLWVVNEWWLPIVNAQPMIGLSFWFWPLGCGPGRVVNEDTPIRRDLIQPCSYGDNFTAHISKEIANAAPLATTASVLGTTILGWSLLIPLHWRSFFERNSRHGSSSPHESGFLECFGETCHDCI